MSPTSRAWELLDPMVGDVEWLGVVDKLGAIGALTLVAGLVITRKLVWHKDLAKAETTAATNLTKVEDERDHWRGVALQALGVADKMTVQGEVAAEVLTRLPDPGTEGETR